MGLSNYIASSRISQAGVIPNSAATVGGNVAIYGYRK